MQKSFNILAVIRKDSEPFGNLFYFEITEGILSKSREYGYNIIFVNIDEAGGLSTLTKIFDRGDADGVIFFDNIDFSVIRELLSRELPFVIVDAHPTTMEGYCVSANYEVASYTGTKYLIDSGHKQIGFICKSNAKSQNFLTQVFSGFRKAFDESGFSTPLSFVHFIEDSNEEINNCVDKFVAQETLPTAIMCGTDMIAIRVISRLKEKGFKIPQDISVVGIDDIMISEYIDPKLTTIHIDKVSMGKHAMDLIIHAIEGGGPESITVSSDNLVVRQSVRKID